MAVERQDIVLVLTVHQTVIDQEIVIVRIVQEEQVNNHAVIAHQEGGKEGEVQDRIAVEKEIGLDSLVAVSIGMKIMMSCRCPRRFLSARQRESFD